jgi:ubiquinone/menaquinone biosynthesis C-methylase UbiE
LDAECPGWQGELTVGDIGRLPYKDNFFNAGLDNEAIYANTFDDSVKIYAELFRVTKPGGKLYTRMFAAGCTGENTGTQLDETTWIVGEGPLAGRGRTRFTKLPEIKTLLGEFRVKSVELITRTEADRTQQESEWVVIAEKPAS